MQCSSDRSDTDAVIYAIMPKVATGVLLANTEQNQRDDLATIDKAFVPTSVVSDFVVSVGASSYFALWVVPAPLVHN